MGSCFKMYLFTYLSLGEGFSYATGCILEIQTLLVEVTLRPLWCGSLELLGLLFCPQDGVLLDGGLSECNLSSVPAVCILALYTVM